MNINVSSCPDVTSCLNKREAEAVKQKDLSLMDLVFNWKNFYFRNVSFVLHFLHSLFVFVNVKINNNISYMQVFSLMNYKIEGLSFRDINEILIVRIVFIHNSVIFPQISVYMGFYDIFKNIINLSFLDIKEVLFICLFISLFSYFINVYVSEFICHFIL